MVVGQQVKVIGTRIPFPQVIGKVGTVVSIDQDLRPLGCLRLTVNIGGRHFPVFDYEVAEVSEVSPEKEEAET